jgi:hypothetical protein
MAAAFAPEGSQAHRHIKHGASKTPGNRADVPIIHGFVCDT